VIQPNRLAFLDRLRGLAVVVMFEVHVVHALLAPEARRSPFYLALDAVNGLVAPAFLFCAGFAVARGFDGEMAPGERLARVARRALGLFALGYALHASGLVAATLAVVRGGDPSDGWATFLQADILQIIAVALASVGAASVALGPRPRFARACALAAFGSIAVTPFVRALDLSHLPAAVQPYLTERVTTQFPLVPWLGFVFAGAAVGAMSVGAGRWRRTLLAAAAGSLLVAGLAWSARDIFPTHDPWTAGPAYMLARLGVVAAIGAGVETEVIPGELDRVLRLLGRRSLLVYVAHIVIVYGHHPLSLRSIFGPRLGWAGCTVFWVVVTVAMVALATAREVLMRRGRALTLDRVDEGTAMPEKMTVKGMRMVVVRGDVFEVRDEGGALSTDPTRLAIVFRVNKESDSKEEVGRMHPSELASGAPPTTLTGEVVAKWFAAYR
jgi:uncharacterized membrane protein